MARSQVSSTTTLRIAADRGPENGPAVVLVHGIASSAATFDPLVPMLAGYRVIALELLGFGHSVAPNKITFTVDEHAAALAETIHNLKLRTEWVIVGHSLGALVVGRYAAGHPRGLSAVVLVSPPVYVPEAALPAGPARTAMGLYLRSFRYLRANKEFTMGLSRLVSRLLPLPEILDVNEHNWRAFEGSLQNSIETQTSVADIASIRVPVEIVYGVLDPLVVPDLMGLIGQLRQVTIHRIPRASHLINASLAAPVAAAISRHLHAAG